MGNKENPKVAIEIPDNVDMLKLPLLDFKESEKVRATLQKENKVSIYFNDKYYRTFHFVNKPITGIRTDIANRFIYVYFD